ncbi:hypothetical protein ABT301_00740 [Streptomyces sp. NPDC000987]|uniref:hypothetical protein n=1 Tax=Streptomyces sp. NPDC000987 TaxID=3154374 RepID=UPI00332C8B15
MNEQQPEAQPQVPPAEEERKPVVFAVRIDPALREQIEGLRGITDQSVNDVGVEALNDWVTKTLADETIRAKAMAEIDAEEKRLQERRAVIAGILGSTASEATTSGEAITEATATSRGGRRAKATE